MSSSQRISTFSMHLTRSCPQSASSRVQFTIASVCVFRSRLSDQLSTNYFNPPKTDMPECISGLTLNTGQSHTASRHYSSIDTVLEKECSLGDRVRARCRLAFSAAQNGAYAAAQASLSSLHEQVKGTLKLEQRVSAFARLIALLQGIRKYASFLHLARATHHKSQHSHLAATTSPPPTTTSPTSSLSNPQPTPNSPNKSPSSKSTSSSTRNSSPAPSPKSPPSSLAPAQTLPRPFTSSH